MRMMGVRPWWRASTCSTVRGATRGIGYWVAEIERRGGEKAGCAAQREVRRERSKRARHGREATNADGDDAGGTKRHHFEEPHPVETTGAVIVAPRGLGLPHGECEERSNHSVLSQAVTLPVSGKSPCQVWRGGPWPAVTRERFSPQPQDRSSPCSDSTWPDALGRSGPAGYAIVDNGQA